MWKIVSVANFIILATTGNVCEKVFVNNPVFCNTHNLKNVYQYRRIRG